MLEVSFAHIEKGYILDFKHINSNSAKNPLKKDRVHAYAVIHKVPCIDPGGTTGAACLGDTLFTCVSGWPTAETDCAAKQQNCAADGLRGACVSDLCIFGKASSGNWNPENCPAEIVGP